MAKPPYFITISEIQSIQKYNAFLVYLSFVAARGLSGWLVRLRDHLRRQFLSGLGRRLLRQVLLPSCGAGHDESYWRGYPSIGLAY